MVEAVERAPSPARSRQLERELECERAHYDTEHIDSTSRLAPCEGTRNTANAESEWWLKQRLNSSKRATSDEWCGTTPRSVNLGVEFEDGLTSNGCLGSTVAHTDPEGHGTDSPSAMAAGRPCRSLAERLSAQHLDTRDKEKLRLRRQEAAAEKLRLRLRRREEATSEPGAQLLATEEARQWQPAAMTRTLVRRAEAEPTATTEPSDEGTTPLPSSQATAAKILAKSLRDRRSLEFGTGGVRNRRDRWLNELDGAARECVQRLAPLDGASREQVCCIRDSIQTLLSAVCPIYSLLRVCILPLL